MAVIGNDNFRDRCAQQLWFLEGLDPRFVTSFVEGEDSVGFLAFLPQAPPCAFGVLQG